MKEVARLKFPGPKMLACAFAFTNSRFVFSVVKYEYVL
jgi:hypothetical protein